MTKILVVGDSPALDTGFGRVLYMINEEFLKAGYSVQQIAWCHPANRKQLPYPIHPSPGKEDYFAQGLFNQVVNDWKPDVVFTLGDVWMVSWIADSPYRNKFKWVSYFPLDGAPIPHRWIAPINNMDVPIVYSEFAERLVNTALPKKDVELILHGVDTKLFRPLENRDEIRKSYTFNDKFIVGTVARNSTRKNLPALLKAFAEFKKGKSDVLLYLHTVPNEQWGWDLPELVSRYRLNNEVCFTSGLVPGIGIPDETLINIYNIFDLFVLPTMGEGFGLPILEAHSCGVPVLVTDFSSCTELTLGKDELIDVLTTLTVTNNIEHAVVNVDDMVVKMNRFYNDRKLLKEYARKGREFALTLDWKKVLPKFVNIIKKVEGEIKHADTMESKLPRFHRV